MRDSIAIVVQRCHPDITGGSESHALEYGKLLSLEYNVEILTTDACDGSSWSPCGESALRINDHLLIRRFPVTGFRTKRWYALHKRLSDLHKTRQSFETEFSDHPWSPALQEMWIKEQGPWSDELLQTILKEQNRFNKFIFITYLYPGTYYGMFLVPQEKRIFVPTLHDEPPAYLPLFAWMARRAKTILYNGPWEADLAEKIWKVSGSSLGGVPITCEAAKNPSPDEDYLLYLGRIHPGKGCDELIRLFKDFQANRNSNDLKLYLAGSLEMTIGKSDRIKYLGRVSESEKWRLLAGAKYLIQPSIQESLSLVVLESLGIGTPVLAKSGSDAVEHHIRMTKGGALYNNTEEFAKILGDKDLYESLRRQALVTGPDYIRKNYAPGVILDRLVKAITM